MIAVLFLLLVPLAAGPAASKDRDQWEEYNGWKIKSFKLEGVPKELEGDLRTGLAQTGKWKILRGLQRPEFSMRQLAEDLTRIRLFLARNGFPAATVEPLAETDPEGRQLDLTLRVKPGDPVRIDHLEWVGWPEGVAIPDTAEAANLSRGEILRDARVEEARAALIRLLHDAGYAQVAVTSTLRPEGLGRVTIVYEVTPGDFYRITEVNIVGCSDDLLKVARRVMNVEPGVAYSQALLSRASLDLRSTQLFGMVILQIEPVRPGELKLTANLENGRMKTIEASVGTFSDNPWLVRGGWRHRNLFRNGVGFDATGVVGTHRLGAGVGANWLGFLRPRARSRVGLGFLIEDEDAYLSRESRIGVSQSFRPRGRDIWNVGVTMSYTEVDRRNPDATDVPESQGRLLEVWTDVKWDRTDDPLFPKKGGFFKASFTVAPPGFFSEIPYVGIQLDGSAYRSPLDPVVFAGRFRLGWAKPLGGGTEVLATRRFYAGGYNTQRGYGRRKLGPLDDAGDALGGEFVALAGLEIRFPMIWIFDGGVFVDSGQVWGTPQEAELGEIPVAVGVDLDIRTPLGPVRGGWGWNVLNRVEGQPHDIFHFGIGYPW